MVFLDIFKSLFKRNEAKSYKIIVLGLDNAGKTTLLKVIRDNITNLCISWSFIIIFDYRPCLMRIFILSIQHKASKLSHSNIKYQEWS
jgi:predicted AAA+ superfamily ATPase